MNKTPKFKPNIHHRRSIRLKGFDYARPGRYFITLCCQDRAPIFGKIIHGKMILNEYGTIAHNEWMATTIIRPNVTLGEFLTMPNHMHGIIILHVMGVSHSPPKSPSQTIGAIIRAYKSAVTKQLHNLKMDCTIWQRNYYVHIIRDERSYQRISNYIKQNPEKWTGDKFFKKI